MDRDRKEILMSKKSTCSRWGMTIAAAVFFIASAVLPAPAKAGGAEAVTNWFGNVVFGWADCFKGMADEFGKAESRGYFGVLFTAPLSCGANIVVRYVGNAADVVVILATGKNTVNPATLQSWDPPVQFPR